MILRPPKKYSEYLVNVPQSIDFILKSIWKLNTGGTSQTLQEVTDAGNTTTNTINVAGTTTDFVQLDTAATPTLQPGMFGWNNSDGTANLRLKGNNVTLQVGQENVARVVNKTGADLLESQYRVVRVRIASEGGSQGQRLAVVLAQGNNDPDSATTLGLVTENIANNQEGFITTSGNVNGINTTGSLQGETWLDGDVLYLNPTISGALTKVKPVAPQHTVILGYVLYAHNNQGKIFVKVDNGYELEELHDVLPTPYINNGVLYRDTATNLWKSATIDTILGGTPLVAVPTLAQVTTAGNTTTNAITVGRLVVNTSSLVVFPTTFNVGINTATDSGQKLQVSGSVFIKGTTSLTATKVFEVQNGAGESIMDFRDSTYAFFGCGQGGGSATGFIFNYSNTSYCQFSGYNYGAGAGAYKPILLDTDIVGRGNGVFVNFGVSTNPPPNSDTEFGVRGRTADTTSFIARFRNSSNTDMFAIRADGALYTDSQQGYSGTLSIPGNPPGSTTITITNGLITNIA